MARTRLTIPNRSVFSTTTVKVEPKYVEENQLEHRALINLLRQSRLAFLKKHGMSEKCIDGNTGMVIGDLSVEYVTPAYLGDVLTICLSIGDCFSKGCEIYYHVTNKQAGQVISRAKTGIVFFDTKQLKAVSMPKAFKKVITEQMREPAKVTSALFNSQQKPPILTSQTLNGEDPEETTNSILQARSQL